MESGLKINNEIADLIIKLCFSINDLKMHSQLNNKQGLHFFTIYEEIKAKIDEILQATSETSMLAKIKTTMAFTENLEKIYKMLPENVGDKEHTIVSIGLIINQLTALEKNISNQE